MEQKHGSGHSKLGLSPHSVYHDLGSGEYALWNKYFPCVLTLPEDIWSAVQQVRDYNESCDLKEILPDLLQAGLVCEDNIDRSKELFFESISKDINDLKSRAADFLKNKPPYTRLYLSNTACNLRCPYCVNNETYRTKNSGKDVLRKRHEKEKNIFHILDQYLGKISDAHLKEGALSFNGGEILLEWDLLKNIFNFVKEKYPDITMDYALNTNLTRLTPEIAEVLHEFKVKVYISIDGYREEHDTTRIYANGRGSFQDVMRGITLFNEINKEYPITAFQGTIYDAARFDADKFFAMARYGFTEARMSPNLFNTTAEDGEKKAGLVISLFRRGLNEKMEYTDQYFRHVKKVMDNSRTDFFFFCTGLTSSPSFQIHYNFDADGMSLLCDYVLSAKVKYDTVEGDIYHPQLWSNASQFIGERFSALKKWCADCEVVGVCRGSCIMMGMDMHNQLNPAACAYQRTLWRHLLCMVNEMPEISEADLETSFKE